MIAMNRRMLMGAAAGAALATPALMSRQAQAQAQSPTQSPAPAQAPANTSMSIDHAMPPETSRFKLGDFEVVVVKDGSAISAEPGKTFGTNQAPEEVAKLLQMNFLPGDRFVNTFSPTLINTGAETILFDTGFGAAGRANGNGRLVEGLMAAGYSPEDISIVVLTHMHGDHIGGLMENGKPAFPNARYIMGETEYGFWTDPARVGTPAEGGHKGVLANVQPLAEKTTFIKEGASVVSGITALEAAGHTPGHMIFHVESAGRQLLLTADTANHFVLSLQRPDWEVRFDMDKAKAAASRKKVFDMVATDRLAFLGYHMPFPAVGFIEQQDVGYRFVPKSYQFDL